MVRRPLSTRGSVSVVVPCEPGAEPSACLAALRALPRAEKALIRGAWVAYGRNPSRQRNQALAGLRTPFVLFLDSDSRLQAGCLPRLLKALSDPGLAACGGPNLPLEEEPAEGRVSDAVLRSWFGSMGSRARYAPVGEPRLTGEKELILCNLLARREAFARSGGFREDLYPNEENELFNRWQAQGWRLAYEPMAWVRRPRRRGLKAFAWQAFRYGRGRAQQMRASFHAGDLLNLLPLALPLAWAASAALAFRWPAALALPAAYLLACLAWGRFSPAVAAAFCLRHHAYALGLLAGVAQGPAARPLEVRLRRVGLAGKP